MTAISIPLERFFFGNEHWDSDLAIDEINIYCELLEHLQDKIDSLGTRGKDEELTLLNVQAVISSYAFEIAMKSLWALDNPDKTVPQKHNLVAILGGVKAETVKSLERLQQTSQKLKGMPQPFVSNRYSMEWRNGASAKTIVYPAPLLRALTQLLRDKLEENRETLSKLHNTFTV